jgi:hypothetical protein
MGSQSKAIGGALAGAVSTLAIWGLTAGLRIEVPTEVAGAIAVVIGFALVHFMPANA